LTTPLPAAMSAENSNLDASSTPDARPVSSASEAKSRPDSSSRPLRAWRNRARTGLIITLIGLFIFLIGARPSLFGLDRSPVIGFVQISVFLIGLAIICLGGFISLRSIWRNQEMSIPAEIGMRLVATGYVIAVFAGMADIFGMGSHHMPSLFFGPWQARGVEIGELLIGIGFIMLLPFNRAERKLTPKSGD
jgi:hypothetical protein